jgi:hypothetical protein
MLSRLFDLYPSPKYSVPQDIGNIARAVVERFDEELELDEKNLVLKNECKFFYRRVPYSPNRTLNSFCDQNLQYDQGDVFVLVGRVIPENVEQYVTSISVAHAELFLRFRSALENQGYCDLPMPLSTSHRGVSNA